MSSSKVLVGFLAGAAIGALAGVLMAPDKGSETRKRIAGKAGDLTDSVKKTFGDFIDNIRGVYSEAKDDAEDIGRKVSSNANTAKNEIKNALS